MKFLVPQGVGDSLWALTKVTAISERFGDGKIEIYTNCSDLSSKEESRAAPFLRRFNFVEKVGQVQVSIRPPGPITDSNGYYRYIPDGAVFDGIDYTLMPNAALERGIRLENWLPEFRTDWGICERFIFSGQEERVSDVLWNSIGNFAVFFMAHLQGNTVDGHNRGPLWHPEDWVRLGEMLISELDLSIIVIGGQCDESYWKGCVSPRVEVSSSRPRWFCKINQWELPQVFAVIKRSKFVVSYQSGVGMFASYLGVPLSIFWRPRGDSISPHVYTSFEEEMASAWVPPKMLESGKHLPLIYGRCNGESVFDEIRRRGWSC